VCHIVSWQTGICVVYYSNENDIDKPNE
jgi:hypothetical protein